MKLHPQYLVTLAVPLAAGACVLGTPGGTEVTTAPLSPSPTAPGPSATPASAAPTLPAASASPSPAGVFFRDDFDGDALDPSRWTVHERDGRVLVGKGQLEMLVGGQAASFPLVLPKHDNLPKEGPYYVETRYTFNTTGRVSGFNLDYVPLSAPDDPGITEPFLRWSLYALNLNFLFKTESQQISALPPANALAPKVPHRFRLEFDGEDTYRVIYDDQELSTFESRRRPALLWFGVYPNKPGAAASWASWSVDYVESGVLVTPDPARPRAASQPSSAPTPTPAAGGAPAGPSPGVSPAG